MTFSSNILHARDDGYWRLAQLVVILLVLNGPCASAQHDATALKAAIEQIEARVLTDDENDPRRMLGNHIRARRQAVNQADVAAWRKITTREQWNALKNGRIAALKQSLGQFPAAPQDLHKHVTRTIEGDGFRIDNVLFESRPGLLVTANLYSPASARESMPGILICHSHHNPKTQSELQDMGMTWARQGCVVLVMDQLGHGERRQHPFRSSADYDGEFRVSRQDYYFRYNTGMQLHVIGDSLIGWMAWDLMRGVDLLLGIEHVDPARIILLGAVAGGGDPVAVTAAIDERIQAVAPFNFGGPQPETTLPLPEDADLNFNYVGGGSWESTRNLRVSARDGFLPWVIVGSVAPRHLVYAHEFSWDRENDPVWKRLESIFGLHGQRERLASVHGFGRVTMSSSQASHCNNIGSHHRSQLHPLLATWLGIPAPDPEYRQRLESSVLLCVEGVAELPKLHKLADTIARQRIEITRAELGNLSRDRRCAHLAERWRELCGVKDISQSATSSDPVSAIEHGVATIRVALTVEPGIRVPLLLLMPKTVPAGGCPAVVAVAQSGKSGFLKHRSEELAALLAQGVAVCLPDLRGTGETRPGDYRGRRSDATGLSSNELMLGGTLVGGRLTDLLSVVNWLRSQPRIHTEQVAVWGDSFAPLNESGRRIEVPLDASGQPAHSEPLGPMLALLAGVVDEKLTGVVARNGLVGFRSLLDSQFAHVPHDIIVPGALTAGDLSDLARAIQDSGRPVRVEGLLDGTIRRAPESSVTDEWPPTVTTLDFIEVLNASR